MVNIQQETENAPIISKTNTENGVQLSESQETLDSIHEDACGYSKPVAGTSNPEMQSSSQSSNETRPNLLQISEKATSLFEKVPEISKWSPKASSQAYENASLFSLESDEGNKFIPSKEIANTRKNKLEIPLRPICRDGSSLSSFSDEEIPRLSENLSTSIIPENEIIRTNSELEAPPLSTRRKVSNSSVDSEVETSSMSIVPYEGFSSSSRNALHNSSAPTIKDGSSLSLHTDDENTSASENAIARIGFTSDSEPGSSESDSDEGNALSQLPQNLVAQTPQVLVDNSSDVHIGPHFQYSGPITVKQYITVNGREGDESDSALPSSSEVPRLKEIMNVALNPQGDKNDSSFPEVLAEVSQSNNRKNFVINSNYNQRVQNNLNNGTKMNGNNCPKDGLFSGSEDALLNSEKNFFSLRSILISVFIVIILIVCISLSLVLPGILDSSSGGKTKPPNININCKVKDLRVPKGVQTVQWTVDITSTIGKLHVDWYGPGCHPIDQVDGPSKYEIQFVYPESDKIQTVLSVKDISPKDRGIYKLHVYNEEDELWDYFSLVVLDDGHIVACYVAEWAHLRRDLGKFTVDDVDPTQCTHLIFAFASMNTDSNIIYPSDPEYDLGNNVMKGAYEKMTSFKKMYPHLKVLIGMGGWAERINKNYSIVAESPDRRRELVASIVHFIRECNFDGLDFHWQYPTEQNGVPADKQNFVYLLKELREAFDKQGKNWLLTIPVGVQPDTLYGAYQIDEISKHVNYLFALCYAYHGFWDHQTGPNAPLYRSKPGDKLNVEASIQELLKLGAPAGKLVLGLPLNGRSFLLERENNSVGFGALTVAEGFIGPYVQEQGFWGYNEICLELGKKNSNWITRWDNVTATPYMVLKEKFISYDDERSLSEKVEFAVRKKLAGVVVYALDTDDFRGECAFDNTGVTNYPLMRAINKAFYFSSFKDTKPCPNAPKPKLQSNEET